VRVCSLLPSATEIVAELGLVDSLVGVSDECRWPPEVVGKPIVTAARIDSSSLTSVQIDEAVRASVSDGRSLYAIESELLDELHPDLVITQDLCAVCAVSGADVAGACRADVETISLDPRTYTEVAQSVRLLAGRLGVVERGEEIASRMLRTLEDTRRRTRGLRRRRVFFAEWLDPPFCAGHWLPEMIEAAGGTDVLGQSGEPSRTTSWEEVLQLAPELVVAGPCGFGAEEAASRARGLDLPCELVVVDGDAYYSRPGPRLADGVRQLAHLLHPAAVGDPGLPVLRQDRAWA
jgi:iron complex transport system substrate-binding protein